jgi:hypothetical protein
MTIGYAELCAADEQTWHAGATVWRLLAERIEERVADLDAAAAGLAESWRGSAADAARITLAGLRDRTASCRLSVARTGQVIAEHAGEVALARAAVATATTPEQVDAALTAARQADGRAAAALAELANDPPGADRRPPPPSSCPPPGGAGAVRLWWDGLTAAQRRWLIERQPVQIGGLDGVPAADRDLANRETLRREHDRLTTLLDALRGQDGARHERERVRAALAGLTAIESRLDRSDPPAYLLGLDTRGDGRAIVSIGDPDHADNVLTFVPGMNTKLDGHLARVLDRTAAMGSAARQADQGTSTAAVLWLGYDTPDTLPQAASSGSAHAARADLHDFQEALAVTHEGPIAEQSLVGHSYGALVIGETARDLGVRADDLVFLGAPGVGVAHAADLHVDPATVWAASADNDIVGLAAPSVKQLLIEQVWPRYMGDPMPDLWHGHNPADAGFGGHVVEAADRANPITAHLSYWDAGNPALTNVGLIAAGREDAVTTPASRN